MPPSSKDSKLDENQQSEISEKVNNDVSNNSSGKRNKQSRHQRHKHKKEDKKSHGVKEGKYKGRQFGDVGIEIVKDVTNGDYNDNQREEDDDQGKNIKHGTRLTIVATRAHRPDSYNVKVKPKVKSQTFVSTIIPASAPSQSEIDTQILNNQQQELVKIFTKSSQS
ncbi:MAG: hypothetical protein EZS28_000032 [Streblomastix strix]|uniref:Uncharacterized protein n=1 Tax=Streblomastix strix TaxID=222440 RepID=A0A5J4XC76_9EUKA|nr:MAG: hypothetical protein EZS28_000032 [Streblomastix strix]